VTRVVVVDGANVVGSVPDGWWKDRPGAARRLHDRLLVADTAYDEVVLVLEGKAKTGVPAGRDHHVRTVHAPRDGDSAILAETRAALSRGAVVTVVSADRGLGAAVTTLGAALMSPSWLLDQV
jgi:hypothetical protein